MSPIQRNKARHLAELTAARHAELDAMRRVRVAVAQARAAGATWQMVAEAAGLQSRQHAYQLFSGFRFDPDADFLWREAKLPDKGR